MIDFENTNKRHLSEAWKCWLLVLVVCTMAAMLGYSRGVDKVQDEAVDMGYADNQDGFRWKSRRLIEIGDEG
jgi:hypothetical protein